MPQTIEQMGDEWAKEEWTNLYRRRLQLTRIQWNTLAYVDSDGPLTTRDAAEHFKRTVKATWTRLAGLRDRGWVVCRDGFWTVQPHRQADLDKAKAGETMTLGKLLAIKPRED